MRGHLPGQAVFLAGPGSCATSGAISIGRDADADAILRELGYDAGAIGALAAAWAARRRLLPLNVHAITADAD